MTAHDAFTGLRDHVNGGDFRFEPGPVFHNVVLADEINRAPAKVQSALLEAMGERQVTVERTTHQLPAPFLVMATQNPIEQEGTYPLPEAQRDRFLLHVRIDHPDPATERRILALVRREAREGRTVADRPGPRLAQDTVQAARHQVLNLYLAPELEGYIVDLVGATRRPAAFDPGLDGWIAWGASPRARAWPWTGGRGPWRGCAAATTYRPMTFAPSPPTCRATASCSASRPRPKAPRPMR